MAHVYNTTERNPHPGAHPLTQDNPNEHLNEAQQQAVEHEGSPLIVLAGPGTGKTRVIIHRIAHMIRHRGVEPESIAALTFTNKAAEELRTRLADMLDSTSQADRVVAGTFHSFGMRLIRRYADMVGWRSEPKLIDDAQQRALMRKIIDETRIGLHHAIYDPYALVPKALNFIGNARNWAIFPDGALTHAEQWNDQIATDNSEETIADRARCDLFHQLATLYSEFDQRCMENGWATFDDLQVQPLRLMREHDMVRALVRTEYSHIVVDEYQDVNLAQIELLKCMAGPTHDLCVVGDDDQSIFGFRGSLQSSFTRFIEHWIDTETIELTENYRSTAIVLQGAHRVIQKSESRFHPDKQTIAAGPLADDQTPIEFVTYTGTDGAGPAIGRMILDQRERDESSWSQFAVLIRLNRDLQRIASAFDVLGVPYEMPQQPDGFEHPAVRDVLSWLHLIDNPSDDSHTIRLLVRPPYGLDLLTLSQWHKEHRRVSAKAKKAELAEQEEETNVESGQENEAASEASKPFVERLIEWDRVEEIGRFGRIYRHLREFALTEPIDAVVVEIIRQAGLITVEPEEATTHRVRIEQLGRFLGFVRDRVGHIEPPRRVRQFLTWLDDSIKPHSDTVSTTMESQLDDDSGIAFSDRDAVRLLTAHKAKGLEFDTVFVPRINRFGFTPTGHRRDDPDDPSRLPPDLIGNEELNPVDEERRLFFVAMTRARQRLILMAQTRENTGRKTSPSAFWNELIEDGVDEPPLPRVIREATGEPEDEPSDTTPPVPSELIGPSPIHFSHRMVLHREITGLLDQCRNPNLEAETFQQVQRHMQQAMTKLALLSSTDQADSENRIEQILSWADPTNRPELTAAAEDYIESASKRAWEKPLPNPVPPLDLSYSAVDLYNRCPRCYWLKYIVGLSPQPTRATIFGSVIHRALEYFYRRQIDAESADEIMQPPTLDDLLQIGQRAYDELRPPEEPYSVKLAERFENALRCYHEKMHTPTLNPVEVERVITFDYESAGHTHKFESRIDRIDSDGNGFNLIDYKTGKEQKKYLEPKPTDLQFGIYLMALQHWTGNDDAVGSAQYWLTSVGDIGRIDLEKIKLDKIRATIDKTVEGILAGRWEQGKKCTDCQYIFGPADSSPT